MKKILALIISEQFAGFIGASALTCMILLCVLADGDTGEIPNGAFIDSWWIIVLCGYTGMMINLYKRGKIEF